MQLRTEHGTLNIGNKQRPAISVALAPKTSPAHLLTGIAIGAVGGFVVGAVLTLLIGERSLLLVQHLWSRLTGVNEDGERVQFELLLQ